MIYLHLTALILYILSGVLGLRAYLKASPTTGHVVVLFTTCVFVAITFFYLDLYFMILRITNA